MSSNFDEILFFRFTTTTYAMDITKLNVTLNDIFFFIIIQEYNMGPLNMMLLQVFIYNYY